jgi:DNA helicase-2/ATP-dependent DNA helicase PcrA
MVEGEAATRPIYSVTALMVYEACPHQYYTTFVRGIPPPVSRAMRRGASVHSLIARHFRKPELLPASAPPEVQPLLDTFRHSRFNVPPVAVEKPFVLPFGRADVRGRIDLVLPRPDGGLELVDFKSGSGDGREWVQESLQLPLYALATSKRFERPAEDLSYTYFFLGDAKEVSFRATDDGFGRLKRRVDTIIAAIQGEVFVPPGGCTCHACMRHPVPPPRTGV